MAGRGSDADRSKTPAVQHPHPSTPVPPYGTFPPPVLPPPAVPPHAYPPKAPQQQPPPPMPQPSAGHHAIPVGYQSHPYPGMVDGIPMNARERPLPFCGIGVGWALFVLGFFFASLPWYVGAFIMLFVDQDYREKPGLVACTIAAVLTFISVILNAFHMF